MEHEIPEQPTAGSSRVEIVIDKPGLTEAETIKECQSAMDFHPDCVWIKPCYLQAVTNCLRRKAILIGIMVGNQDGSTTTEIKVAEAKRTLTEGATRLGMQINLGYVRERRMERLKKDLHAVSGIAHMNGVKLEASFNPAYLSENDVVVIAQASMEAKIDVLSFPIDYTESAWDFALADILIEKLGCSIPLKGLIHQANRNDLREFFDRGLSSVGISTSL